MTYVTYKFQKAINELSRHGNLNERLMNAYLVNLMHIEPEELPDSIKHNFITFKDSIIQGRQGESYRTVESIVKRLEEADVQRLVDELFKMYEAVTLYDASLDPAA